VNPKNPEKSLAQDSSPSKIHLVHPHNDSLNKNNSVYLGVISTPCGYTAFSRVGDIWPTQVNQSAKR
jgi:hypothetical protein